MTTQQLPPLPEQSMTHHITDEQIAKLHDSMFPAPYDGHANVVRFARAVLAIAAPAPAVPSGWSITDNGDNSITVHGPGLGCTVSDVEEVARRVPSEVLYEFCRAMLTAAPTPPAQTEPDQFVDANKMVAPVALSSVRLTRDTAGMCIVSVNGRVAIRDNGDIIDHIATLEWFAGSQPAVPEDVAREPMTQKWCWWLGDAEGFHIEDTEVEAHAEAQSWIDGGDFMPGQAYVYSVARVQHPIDALGMDWLADHMAESIEENACCWCDENIGAEEPSITLAAEDRKALGTMVATFVREKAAAHWWTADQKTITTHTYVAGSNDADAARAAGGAA